MLTAVDSALMVIDVRQGRGGAHHQADGSLPPARHADHDLHQQARPRGPRARSSCSTKSNRCCGIQCAPVTWPIGMGKRLKGVVPPGRATRCTCTNRAATSPARTRPSSRASTIRRWTSASARTMLAELREELELVQGASHPFDQARLPGRQADAGVLRLGGQQLRRAAAAGLLRRARAGAAAARAPPAARSRRDEDSASPASCSRSRPTWTRSTATASPSCASARASFEAGMKAFHVRTGKEVEARQRADLHGQRPRDRGETA